MSNFFVGEEVSSPVISVERSPEGRPSEGRSPSLATHPVLGFSHPNAPGEEKTRRS